MPTKGKQMRKLSIVAVFLCIAALAAPTISAADTSATGWVQNHGKPPQGTAQKALPAASLKSSTGTKSPNAQTIYTSRAAFDAAAPGLTLEDFEDGNVGPGTAVGCLSPMTSTSNDPPCVDPGDIAAGLTIQVVNNPSSPIALAMGGAGWAGNPTKMVIANYFTDSADYLFNATPFAFGIDLQAVFSAPTLTITLYNGATVIGTYTSPSSAAGTFWGITDDANPVTRINVNDPSLVNAEGGDNIEFGSFIPVELESFQVE